MIKFDSNNDQIINNNFKVDHDRGSNKIVGDRSNSFPKKKKITKHNSTHNSKNHTLTNQSKRRHSHFLNISNQVSNNKIKTNSHVDKLKNATYKFILGSLER